MKKRTKSRRKIRRTPGNTQIKPTKKEKLLQKEEINQISRKKS